MSAPATLVVVNPAAAAGRTGREWPLIRDALDEAGVEFEHRLTLARGDATAITRAALAAGTERVVAVGGDGTLNEVANGFFGENGGPPIRPGAVLGMVPAGTGGDFRRSAGIPREPHAAAVLLARGDRRPCDVGRIEYLGADGAAIGVHHFINIADCGLGGEVALRAAGPTKRAGGRATFAWAAMRSVVSYGRKPARVVADGVPIEGPMQNVVLANGRYFGGGMLVAPDADLADGMLDVVVIGDIGRLRSLLGMPRIYRGAHIGRPGVLVMRAARVEVTPLEGAQMLFDVEGEQIGAAPAIATVLPAALDLCAPRPRGGPVPAGPAS
ncbi:MAG TPA: diacylglycerol kinase family protein [Candidatus Dormibacteraeota bacterium]